MAHACDVGAVCPTQYAQRAFHHFTVWHAPRAGHGRASCRPSVACCIAAWRGVADLHSMPASIFSRGRSLMAPPGRNTVRRCWRVLRGSCLGDRLLALRWRATGFRRGRAIRPEEIAKIVDGHLYCLVCRRSAPASKTFHRPYVRSRHGTLPARKLLQRCEGAGAAAALRSRTCAGRRARERSPIGSGRRVDDAALRGLPRAWSVPHSRKKSPTGHRQRGCSHRANGLIACDAACAAPETDRGDKQGFLLEALDQRFSLIWSKTPPSSKWVFCALRQPPKTSSMVTSFTGANCLAYLAATFGSRGR